MISYKQIIKVVADKLKDSFPGIEITSKDINEGFSRPSFFIDIDDAIASDFMRSSMDREIAIRIYYFSKNKDNNRVDLLNMRSSLEQEIIGIIELDDFTTTDVDDVNFDNVDGVLQCDFTIYLSEDYERVDTTPNMEELKVDI